jgi:site-specific DNA-methyltransferase (adenine-specific)
MEYMAMVPDKYFDLAVVDPPYGIDAGKMTMGSGKHVFKKGKDWDSSAPNCEYFKELFRVSKNQVIWGGNYFTDKLPITQHWIVWDKKNPNLSFAEGELAWVRHGNNLRIFQHYSAMVENGGKIHPTQKPSRLYQWIYTNYLPQGGKVLDTHLGSGSNRIAADKMGNIEFGGCELDKDYYEAQEKRWADYKKQLKLFA